ncbi:nickel-dependent hydrogenase large subunit [Methylocystis sp. SC2]|uniref:nickel-dependent hydrogenase large subunit n=1 Tax=Methylocystis sp. (strain SC2) TaxID=187303 RepID=UPI00027AF2F8|nr:nickel-dependent hydrogenase large subunit [Methylocystis sp. SC2]CCJ07800.1 HyaB-Ni,Fe-hydrogenase I large subunit [Methylocystis sp. SC2]
MSELPEMSTSIGVEVTRIDDRVEAARVTPRRQVDATRILYGKAASGAPSLIGSVFTLCAASQRIASEAAVAAAQARPTPDALRWRWRRMLYAERIAEHLRASLLDWPGEKSDPRRLAHLPALRKALAAARAAGEKDDNSLHAALKEAASEIGAPLDAGRNPTGWFAELWRDALQFARVAPCSSDADFLAIGDADTVHRALRERNANFLARPQLPGRVAETGPFARHFAYLRRNVGLLAARLQARFLDIAYALDALARSTPLAGESDLVVARSIRPGEGFAMVDSPRGFLFHRVEIDASGAVTAYDILAPTEWNFHPAGPFVRALAATRLDVAEPRRFVATLAALFDPCASCDIRLREALHA